MAICVECSHSVKGGAFIRCNNSELSITDFVYGLRDCKELNAKGDCKGFKPVKGTDAL